ISLVSPSVVMKILLLLLLTQLWIPAETSETLPCKWHGFAPICIASCPSGTVEVKRKSEGKKKVFGKSCLLGSKVFCCEKGHTYTGRVD
ncbi:hypothetical protein PFISCL1PPCAC_22815, partial [Pristionchus fissidentatus]